MSTTHTPSRSRPSHPPLWLVEGLDVVEQRRGALISVALGVVAVGGLLSIVAPGVVPPVPLVGAAVGLAALLLGLAVAIALDAADLRLRGPRHVGAAGGELVAVLPTVAGSSDAATLASAVLEAREPGTPLLLGLAASGRDVRPTTAWTDALATALEAEGVSVLRIDLASGHSTPPGLIEVVRDGVKLASAVTFGPEPRLARLGAGADHAEALEALAALPNRLPRDLDVLLVALPMAASRQVVGAVRSLDHVLIVAQRDRTSRVELIAGLDALESAGTRAQVALLDDLTAARLARSAREPGPAPAAVDPATPVPDPASGPSPDPASEPVSELADDEPAVPSPEPAPEPATAPEPAVGEPIAPALEPAEVAAPGPEPELAVDAATAGPDPQPEATEPEATDPDPEPEATDPDPEPDPELAATDPAPEPNPDHDHDPEPNPDPAPEPLASSRRDVEVVHGAAEAAAIALAQIPPVAPAVAPDPGGEADPTADEEELSGGGADPVGDDLREYPHTEGSYPPAAVDLEAPALDDDLPTDHVADDPATEADDDPASGEDATDDVPEAGPAASESPAPISDVDADHDDLLRTTAQLSVLLDDLDVPPEQRPDHAP